MDIGKQFAQYLLQGKVAATSRTSQATHLQPNKEDFISVMESWFDILCSWNQVDSLKECTSTAIDVFPDWKRDILYCTAKLLINNQLYEDSIDFLRMALSCNESRATEPSDLDIQEDLEQVFNRCIPRWHFRMINDISRNRSFFNAIKKAIADGYCSVVDIGAGSGILSLFAAVSGAERILAFEVSRPLCNVAASVVSAYNFESKIVLLNKMSTDHVSQCDDPKPDLAVMEIFDCGLFGEGVLPTLKHGLKQLITPQLEQETTRTLRPKVIPKSARLFATLIECCEIRKHSRSYATVLDFHMSSVTLLGQMDPGDTSKQPYTTENLNYIKGGYNCLSEPVRILEVNFEDIDELNKLTEQSFFVDIPVNCDGQLDAIVTWFELQLDDDITLSSSPHANSCWEQAVYHIQQDDCEFDLLNNHIVKGSTIELLCYCNEEYLQIITHRIHASSCSMLSMNTVAESGVDFNTDSQLNRPETQNDEKSIPRTTDVGAVDKYDVLSKDSKDSLIRSTSSFQILPPNSSSGVTNDNTEGVIEECRNINSTQSMEIETQFASNGHLSVTRANEISGGSALPWSHKGLSGRVGNKSGLRNCSCGSSKLNCMENESLERTYISVNRRKVARMNDGIYYEQYRKAIAQTITERLKVKDHIDVLFICEDISLLPLLVIQKDRVSVDVAVSNGENLVVIEKVARENKIDLKNYRFLRQSLPEVACNGRKYDIIIIEVIEENGMLCQSFFNDIVLIRTFLLKRDGKLIPESLTMIGCVVESSTIENDSFVSNANVTLGYDIGQFLNDYQVSTQPDINLLTLPHKRLTSDFNLLIINFLEGKTDEEIIKIKSPRAVNLNVRIKDKGSLSAIGYWFTIHLSDDVVLSTEADYETHWNQSFVVFKEIYTVSAGSSLDLDIVLNRGNLHIARCSLVDK